MKNTQTKNTKSNGAERNPLPTSAPRERETIALGISESAVARSVESLNAALSNVYVLLIKTKKCHWDVSGPQFMTLHKLLDEQYTKLDEYADAAAERVRMLGAFPVGTAAGFLALTDLKEQPTDIPTATEVVVTLLRDHETLARRLRKDMKDMGDNDAGTVDFFTQMLRGHEEMAWMLRAFLRGDGIHAVSSAQTARSRTAS